MGQWRFYAQRAGSGLWLDTNVQLSDPSLSWVLSGPCNGSALIPAGLNNNPNAEDGRRTWGKQDTILYAEEDGGLAWAGVCTAANPDKEGLHLEFIGPWGWTQRIPFDRTLSVWRTNAFDVVRTLVNHTRSYEPGFKFVLPTGDSAFTVGDPQPPPKPKQPPRKKGETKSEWQSSKRYDQWQEDVKDWDKRWGNNERFEIAWYEQPYVGEEVDTMAKELGFEYRERVKWADRGALIPQFNFDFADDLTRRRDDIQFEDGINIATALDPKDGDEQFANHVIGLGAGEGRKMLNVRVGQADGRLYQAQYVQYKSIRNKTRLRSLAKADFTRLNNKDPKIDTVVAWDVPGFADTSTLRVGDEVKVISQNVSPVIDAWVRITELTRVPNESVVTCKVEVTA